MNPQDKTSDLASPVVSIGLDWDSGINFNYFTKIDDNLCKYLVQRNAYKTVMLCIEPKPKMSTTDAAD